MAILGVKLINLFSSVIGVMGIIFFSVGLLCSGDLVFFWLFLELCGLCLVPCFFLYSDLCVLSSLFNYIVVSSISSSFLLLGVLYSDLICFFILGLLIKFGVFPFIGWVYKVVTLSNWLVVWCMSTLLKLPFFYICYFLSGGLVYSNILCICCCSTFLIIGYLFWVLSFNWFYCWCHMMISSSVSFLLMSFCISLDFLSFLFFVYVCWVSLVITFFSFLGSDSVSLNGVSLVMLYFYCFLLLSTPVSFSLFYKLMMGFSMLSCGVFCVILWVINSVSEQLFLFFNFMGSVTPKLFLGADVCV